MLAELAQGGGMPQLGLLVNHVAVGSFFAISGYHKIMNPTRHEHLRAGFVRMHVPLVSFNEWWVPGWEFVGGCLLVGGIFSGFNAAVLLIICLVATCLDGVHRIPTYKPIDKLDWFDDLLYLPEVCYMIQLWIIIAEGAGKYSIDYLLFN